MLLNLAEICPISNTLGPGKRFIIWVQGCCFNCPGCVSPEWIPQVTATLVEPVKLADYILSIAELEGLTVSGGEPMLQAKGLGELFTYIRQKKRLVYYVLYGVYFSSIKSKK